MRTEIKANNLCGGGGGPHKKKQAAPITTNIASAQGQGRHEQSMPSTEDLLHLPTYNAMEGLEALGGCRRVDKRVRARQGGARASQQQRIRQGNGPLSVACQTPAFPGPHARKLETPAPDPSHEFSKQKPHTLPAKDDVGTSPSLPIRRSPSRASMDG